jgi:inorganic pyrophosphatase
MEIVVVIEDPRGSTVRHHWDERTGRWIEKLHPHSATPWPANYGYIPGTFNPSDNDDLDVLVLSRDPLATGSEITVRVIGLLRRPDFYEKILGVLVGDPELCKMASDRLLAAYHAAASVGAVGRPPP